jgi:CubicO group peptidase (beta-lactamase class C family)
MSHTDLRICIAVLFFSLSALGQQDKSKEIEAYVKPFVDKGHFSGVILAKKDGKIVFEKAYGLANADFKIPNQLNTRFGIASITKPMTVVILIRLLEARKLTYADKLSKFIPDFPSADKITIEHLARHRAGIPHRVMSSELESVSYTSEEMIAKIKQAKLEFEPGERNSYSSGGFTVLARVLEIASGKTYAQLLDEYVFGPAGMKDSLDDPGDGIIDRCAQDYLRDEKGIYNAPLKDYSFLVGAGSVFSTAGDMYKFGDSMVLGTFGEGAKQSNLREGIFTSSGSTNGHRAYLKIDDNKKYGYVLLSNLSTGAFDVISAGIDSILDGKPPVAPVIPNPQVIKLPDAKLSEFLGSYKRDTGGSFDMKLRNGVLYGGDIKLLPVKTDCFFDYKFYGDVCAVRDETGKIKSLTWASPGFSSNWIRQ